MTPMPTPLSLDPEALNTCVACGLCLPHCPTYRVTGEEGLSPRGRIDAMRSVELSGAAVDAEFVEFMSTCVQCRGCEPACPSGVPYGELIEATRTALAERGDISSRSMRWGLGVLRHHTVLLLGSSALALAQRLRLVPKRFALGRIPITRGPAVRATGIASTTDVWLFTGCVMDAWMRSTHRSTAKVLDSMEVRYALAGTGGACCGALHAHAGLHEQSVRMARAVIGSMPGDAPILVNSAGCGAALGEYGRLLGTDEARAFAARVVDVHEYVAAHADRLPLLAAGDHPVIVQDPCHLRHVQRAHQPVHDLIARVAAPVELDDVGLCCGAGGAYAVVEPELAGEIRDRKLAAFDRAIEATGARLAVSANPGCIMHLAPQLADRGVELRHPMDVLADALP